MENIGELMQQYATKEVLTVVAAIATAWVGWRAAVKSVGVAKGFADKASFAGMTSAFLLIAGFAALGLGIGELASRSGDGGGEGVVEAVETQLTNEQLVVLATSERTNDLEEILRYAETRDKAARERQILQDQKPVAAVFAVSDKPAAIPSNQPYEELPFEVEEVAIIENEESIMTTPTAWMTIGLGLASLIGSFGVFTTRKTYTS